MKGGKVRKAITKKQLDIIDEWFINGRDEAAVLQKYNIPQKIWKRWLADKSFDAAITDKLKSAQRQSQILISQYVPMAAAKLIQLCGSDKEETSRRACLDILALQAGNDQPKEADVDDDEEKTTLDDETASKILATLAEN